MKKTLVLAMAAVCMMASCKKNPLPTPEDQTPVAVQFSTNRIDASVTRTKAPVTEWNGEQLYIYGFQVNRGTNDAQIALGSGRYTLASPFINNVGATAPVGDDAGAINVYRIESEPFYYSINTSDVYDFYGYYVGGDGVITGQATLANDVISYPVTINGTQDLMYAKTNKAQDITDASATGVVEIYQAYGAWAARRGVHPTLNFEHALSQFNFKVKRGVGSFEGDLTITSIDIKTPINGTFTVVGDVDDLGFNETPDNEGTQKVRTEHTPASGLVLTEAVEGGEAQAFGTPLMIGPGKTQIEVTVTMTAANYTAGENSSGKITHTMIIKSQNLSGEGATTDAFRAGYSYDVTLIVYGPEQVNFDVSLRDWDWGGYVDYNPDDDNNAPAA